MMRKGLSRLFDDEGRTDDCFFEWS